MSDPSSVMQDLRPVGVIAASLIILYTLYRYRAGKYRRLDLLIGLMLGSGVLIISIYPPAGNFLLDMFQVRNRLFAVLILSNFLLFALFFRALNGISTNRRTIGELIRSLARSRYSEQQTVDVITRKIVVVIPAYNEEDNIGEVLAPLPEQLMGYEVHPLVVVDGGNDRTAEVVRRSDCHVALHVLNRGQGDALRTGFEIALDQGADIVVTMDADGQHRPEEIGKLVKPLVDGDADFVIGSRFLGEYEDRGGARHWGIVFFTWLINLLGGVSITDCTSGFRAILGRGLLGLELREERFSAPELVMEASRKGLRIQEVPVTILRRAVGKSKKPRGLGYPLGFMRAIIASWLR